MSVRCDSVPARGLVAASLALVLVAAAMTPAHASGFTKRAGRGVAPAAMARDHRAPVQVDGTSTVTASWLRLPPPTINEGAVAYDGSRQRLLVFGRADGGGATNELWELALAGTPTWTRLAVSGTLPAPRGAHNLIYDRTRDRLILFGGSDTSGNAMNDVWRLDLGTLPLTWSQGSPPNPQPSPRGYAAAVYDSVNDRIVLFGGAQTVANNGPPSNFTNDVWVLPLGAPPVWTELSPTGTPPNARAAGAAILDAARGRLVAFGGFDGATLADTWELTLGISPAWNELSPAGGPPDPRAIPAVVYDPPNDRMLMYGGIGGQGDVVLHDVWSLALGSPAWSAVVPSGVEPTPREQPQGAYDWNHRRLLFYGARDSSEGTVPDVAAGISLDGAAQWIDLGSGPASRNQAAAIYHAGSNKLVMFGGSNGNATFGDVWEMSLATGRWTEWTVAGPAPSNRAGHSAIYDPVRDRMVIFGGNAGATFNAEMWALSLGGSPAWTQIAPATPESPAGGPLVPFGRSGHSAVYDSRRDRMIVYGGTSGIGPLSDTWWFDFTTHQWTPTNPGPGVRTRHAAVYDDRADRMVIFSGEGMFGDVWQFALPAGTWTQLTVGGPQPSGRSGAVAVYDTSADAMLMFGGDNSGGGGASSDAWLLALRGTPTWVPISVGNVIPRNRGLAAYGYDQAGARLVVFGGEESSSQFSDTWIMNFDRVTPVLGSMVRATARVDRVELTWNLSAFMSGVQIQRHDPGADWRTLVTRNANPFGRIEFVDFAVTAGTRYGYRLSDGLGNVIAREEWIVVPLGSTLELAGFAPNPARADVRLAFTLANASPARIDVLDLAGRRVFGREVSSLGAGRHVLSIGDSKMDAGVYLVRLTTGDGTQITRRAILLR